MIPYSVNPLDDLLSILEKFKNENDFLSTRIFRWSVKLLKAIGEHDDPEKITQVALEHLDILKKILVSPIGEFSLREPVVERFWVWEKSIHELFRKLFDFSPLDDGPWMENPPPHYFAIEMLNWAKGLVPDQELSLIPLNQNQLIALANCSQLEGEISPLFQQIAELVRWREQTMQSGEDWEWMLMEVEAKVAQIQELSELEKDEKNALQSEQHLQEQIDRIAHIYSEALTGLQNQISWKEEILMKKVTSLENHNASLDQANASIIADFKREVENLMQQYQGVVSTFENKLATQSKDHQTAKLSLENWVNIIQQYLSSTLASLASLENQYTQLQQNLQRALEDLRIAQSNSWTQQVEINRLNNSYQLLQYEASRHRSKNRPCIIL